MEKYWKQVKFLEKLGLYSTLDDKKRLMPQMFKLKKKPKEATV